MKGMNFFAAGGAILLPVLAPFLIFPVHVRSIIQDSDWPLYGYRVVGIAATVFVPELLLNRYPQASWRIGVAAWMVLFGLAIYASVNLFGVDLGSQ